MAGLPTPAVVAMACMLIRAKPCSASSFSVASVMAASIVESRGRAIDVTYRYRNVTSSGRARRGALGEQREPGFRLYPVEPAAQNSAIVSAHELAEAKGGRPRRGAASDPLVLRSGHDLLAEVERIEVGLVAVSVEVDGARGVRVGGERVAVQFGQPR